MRNGICDLLARHGTSQINMRTNPICFADAMTGDRFDR